MGLPWIRVDVALPRNHKILALRAAKRWQAIVTYQFGLLYVGEQGTDGFIPREAMHEVCATAATARQLVEVGLWHEDPGGWLVNGWADKQLTSSDGEARSNRARSAAQVRWDKKKKGAE